MTAMARTRSIPRRAQRGVVLYISLLLLLALTLIGLAATRRTTFDDRMAAVQRDQDFAFQAAEAALRDGEALVQNASPQDFTGINGYYGCTASITWTTADWSDKGRDPALKTIAYDGSLDPTPAHAPRFYLVRTAPPGAACEQSTADAPANEAAVYVVIAKAWGVSENNAVVLESTYRAGEPGGRLSWQQLQ